mgnify:CR=1 FL=1
MRHSMFEKIGLSIIIFAWTIFVGIVASDNLVVVDNSNIDALRLVTEETEQAMETEEAVEAAPVIEDLATLMASADLDRGKKLFKNCKACHGVDNGGKHKVGPNLWNIVGRAQGKADGYKYSDAFKALDGTWGVDELDQFLTKPGDYISGTKMKFKGIKKANDRAALILFLDSQK